MPTAPPDPDAFRKAMGALPTGVTIVTASGEHGRSGATANAVSSLSLEPMMMLACLDRGSRTLRSIEHAGRFGVNVLGAGSAGATGGEALARRFSTKVPEDEKWTGVAVADRDGIPVLDDAILWVGCELQDKIGAGDHVIVTGSVSDLLERDGAPLVFHRGTYRSLG
jgi:flavin reductase (DIM6/NTAB) family NADH-FMN oxidoreductase RutF